MSLFTRRSILKVALMAPLATMLPRLVFAAKGAAPANALGEKEPLANAMKYVEDATKAPPAMRVDKKATCANCSKFNKCAPGDSACKPGAKGAAYAPCEIFAGKVVAAPGWCLSWTKMG